MPVTIEEAFRRAKTFGGIDLSEKIPRMTPEQIALVRKIEGIFSPLASLQREAKRSRDNPGNDDYTSSFGWFSHYTSADAALKIIEGKRLWMRSTTVMVDFSEVDHGYLLLQQFFRTNPKAGDFYAVMDSIHPGTASAAVGLFDAQWPSIRSQTYIASLSDHKRPLEDDLGRLSMWRAFRAGEPRVALVIKLPWYTPGAAALGIVFSPVAYLDASGAEIVLGAVLEKVKENQDYLRSISAADFQKLIFQTLVAAVVGTKHLGFKEEDEWRAIYNPAFERPTILEESDVLVAGVPQRVLSIPLDENKYPQLEGLDLTKVLDRVVIGPTPYPMVMVDAFVRALRKAGVPDPEKRVFASNIPIRNS